MQRTRLYWFRPSVVYSTSSEFRQARTSWTFLSKRRQMKMNSNGVSYFVKICQIKKAGHPMPRLSSTILQSIPGTLSCLTCRMTYKEMKHTALQNIINLERTGKITRQNGYQDLLNSIATDIRTKHRRRITRQNELESTHHTLAQLEEKAEFLKEQLAQYELVIDQNKKTMQTNKGYSLSSTGVNLSDRKRPFCHSRNSISMSGIYNGVVVCLDLDPTSTLLQDWSRKVS
jgi:hypothetical protein